jgi:hypothetical protein
MRRGLLLFCALVAVSCEEDAAVDLYGEPLYSQHKEELILRDSFTIVGRVSSWTGCATPIRDSNT